MDIKTLEGKIIKVCKSEIIVSKNYLIEGGYFFELRVVGTLPKCRKPDILTTMFCIGDYIKFTTLFEHRSYHSVSLTELSKLIDSSPIVKYFGDSDYDLTDEVKQRAKKYIESLYLKKE